MSIIKRTLVILNNEWVGHCVFSSLPLGPGHILDGSTLPRIIFLVLILFTKFFEPLLRNSIRLIFIHALYIHLISPRLVSCFSSSTGSKSGSNRLRAISRFENFKF
ncbi:hypothetical protein YC2023_057951 [Brassica napus]